MTRPRRRSTISRLLESEVPLLIKLAEEHQVVELKIQRQGTTIHLRRGWGQEGPVETTLEGSEGRVGPPPERLHTITAPRVGHFYFAHEDKEATPLQPGQVLTKGQRLGLVETLDIHTDVPVEEEGELVALLVQDGQAVEYGQPLAQIRPS